MADSQETTDTVDKTRSTRATSSTPTTGNASLFGVGQPASETTTSASLKRKTTDTNLEIITVDSMYNLTLIVGSTEHPRGQKAFRVGKSSFRNASKAWTSMLSGKWAEGDMSEIRFPDDSCYAFQIVLQIAHWQFHKLPASLTRRELVELAVFSDKYDLGKVIHTAVELKKWIRPYKGAGTAWPLDVSLQDFAFITAAFDFEDDYACIVSCLAMELRVTKNSNFYLKSNGQKVLIRPNFQMRILAEVKDKRTRTLQELVKLCKRTIEDTARERLSDCGLASCPLMKAGIVSKEFYHAGLDPLPENASALEGSVCGYWKDLKAIDFDDTIHDLHILHAPNPRASGCFGDFGLTTALTAMLMRHTHKDLWKQYELCVSKPREWSFGR